MDEAAFLILILSGVAILLGGMLWTRLNWRADVPPHGRHTRFLDVTLHPERYAKESALPVIRTLNRVGGLCVAGAIAVLAYRAFKDFVS